MRAVLTSNDLVRLSWAEAVLAAAGITVLVLDAHMAAMEGGIPAIARRLMVDDSDWAAASAILRNADPDRMD